MPTIKELIQEEDLTTEEAKKVEEICTNFTEGIHIPEAKEFKEQLAHKIEKQQKEKEEAEKIAYLETIPSFAKWRYRLAGFATAFVIFLVFFISGSFYNFFSGKILVEEKFTPLSWGQIIHHIVLNENDNSPIRTNGIESFGIEKSKNRDITMTEKDTPYEINQTSFSNPYGILISSKSEKNYQFDYNGKKYPKIKEELPIYKENGALLSEEKEQQSINTLKIGNIALKNFGKSTFEELMIKNEDTHQMLFLNLSQGKASIITENILFDEQTNETTDTPNIDSKKLEKEIRKKIEESWISLKEYTNFTFTIDEDNLINFFFQQLIEGYEVYSPSSTKIIPVGIQGRYNTTTKEFSLNNYTIAKYQVEKYPTLSKEEVIDLVPTGWDFFHGGNRNEEAKKVSTGTPKLIYLYDNGYYVPALQFIVDFSKTNIETPTSVLYIQLIK